MTPLGWILGAIIFAAVVAWGITREPRKRHDLGKLPPHWRGTTILEDELHRARQERK